MFYKSLPVCFLLVGAALCAPEKVLNGAHENDDQNNDLHEAYDPGDHVASLEKRSPHYSFGLGKRAYSYVSEYKRLPVYNFGLGKRSSPYSFGLGKRSIDENEENEVANDLEHSELADIFDQYDDEPEYEKRARPYTFGLGKRSENEAQEEKRARMYEFGLGKRIPLYNFGMGKRARAYNFGMGKRAKAYSFGLGKRLNNKFTFGLGKREGAMNRFRFGLGKRSPDSVEDEDNYFDV